MKVLYHQSVEDSLFELIRILYNEEYFGFYESAIVMPRIQTDNKIH
jgi:hypothetical protein